jgi:SAM-dependent methyltransferase
MTPEPSAVSTWDQVFGDFYVRSFASVEDPEAREQALAAMRLAGVADGAEVLDVPCGFGRHSIPLAEAGYRITGVDRSPALVEEARRRAGGARWPKLVRADYRDLPLGAASFDAALNLFTSLGYLGDEEDTKALTEIGRVLRPGAPLVIDILDRDRLVTILREQDWRLLGEGRLLLEQRTFDPASGVVQTTQTVIPARGDRESRTFSLRVYCATELLAMLDRAGFSEARCYGGFDGRPFAIDTRLVIVARR